MSTIKVDLLCNGWRCPVNPELPLGNPVKLINVTTRLHATIDGTPEQIAALEEGIAKEYRPEFWIVQVKE